MTDQTAIKPSVGTTVTSTALTTLLAGGAAAGAVAMTIPHPQRENYVVSNQEQYRPSHSVAVEIHDRDGVLNAEDQRRLLSNTDNIEVAQVVKQVHYIVFRTNDENVNDTVENYLRDQRPDLIGKEYFADGVLIIGVGLDPRQAFIFAGNDVADAFDLRESAHLEQSLDAIKPGAKDGNIPAGLSNGLRTAVDVRAIEEQQYNSAVAARMAALVGGGLGAASGGFGIAGIVGITRRRKSRIVAQARDNMNVVSREYGELAQRLDATLRNQWADVRDRFLRIHDSVDTLGNLVTDSDYYSKSHEISTARETTEQISYAESNIDTLFRLENGDAVIRVREADALYKDMLEALGEIKISALSREVERLKDELLELKATPESPQFLDRYATILTSYQTVLEQVRKQQFSDVKESTATTLAAPAIYESGYRPGYGMNNFVPFWIMSSWHTDNIAAQEAASASSSRTNTSFSSGFSGAGGSSSF
ncbi:DUF5129 domain-containing protein [Corynebacterium diphtheriae]|nr:DUF5129 domain-containing protein [Corynebacterium diphtheriae]RKW87403.1 DUF5129 domain-containing protein [Corynebacterium diphtheriae]